MNPLYSNLTPARHWKDIPQAVSHRAMSSEGRRRVVWGVLKTIALVATLGVLAWGGFELVAAFQEAPGKPAGVVKSAPLQDLVLITDGSLDQAWLTRTLALPKGSSLMALDLFQLRTRLLTCEQVGTATVTRNFPSTLSVTIAERMPVVRLRVQDPSGAPRTLFVARDGAVYDGINYDPKMIETLPWLAGVRLTRQAGVFQPVAGMDKVAELLAKTKLEAEHLYSGWQRVSLERFATDNEIEVHTKEGTTIIFGTNEDFFRQLANLDAILDAAKAQPDKLVREIDLSVGTAVPVTFDGLLPQPPPKPAAGTRSASLAGVPHFPLLAHH